MTFKDVVYILFTKKKNVGIFKFDL